MTEKNQKVPGFWYPREAEPDKEFTHYSEVLFYTRRKLEGGKFQHSMRLWEEGSWWSFTRQFGWTRNNSFDEWLFIDLDSYPSLTKVSESLGVMFEHGA